MVRSQPKMLCQDEAEEAVIPVTAADVCTVRRLSLTPREEVDVGWEHSGANCGVLSSRLQPHHFWGVTLAAGSGSRAERFLHHSTPPGRLETMMMACMMREMASDLCSGTPTRLKKNT
jgi:hypothetical protein